MVILVDTAGAKVWPNGWYYSYPKEECQVYVPSSGTPGYNYEEFGFHGYTYTWHTFGFLTGGKYTFLKGKKIGEFIRTSRSFNEWGDKDVEHFRWNGFISTIPRSDAIRESYTVREGLTYDPTPFDGTTGKLEDISSMNLDGGHDVIHNRINLASYITAKGGRPKDVWRLIPRSPLFFIPLDLPITRGFHFTVPTSSQVELCGDLWWEYRVLQSNYVLHSSNSGGKAWPEDRVEIRFDAPGKRFRENVDRFLSSLKPSSMVVSIDYVAHSTSTSVSHLPPKWDSFKSTEFNTQLALAETSAGKQELIVRTRCSEDFRALALTPVARHIETANKSWRTATLGNQYDDKTLELPAASEEYNEGQLKQWLKTRASSFVKNDWDRAIRPFRHTLIRQALDNVRFLDINTTQFIREFRELRRSVMPIVNVLRRPSSPKNWSALWLTWRYGIRLFVNDMRTVVDAVKRDSSRDRTLVKGRSMAKVPIVVDGETYAGEIHLLIRGQSSDTLISRCAMFLRQWDLYVGAKNAWDFIPYSFVVDWFIPVGEMLADCDRIIDQELYKVQHLIWSVKVTGGNVRPPFTDNISCAVSPVFYKRWHEKSTFSLKDTPVPFGDNWSMVHIADGAALVLQRILRK